MLKLSGKSVYKGVALGPVVVLRPRDQQVKRTKVEDADAEIDRLEKAGEKAMNQLAELYNKAVEEVGEASAAIFEVHQMMLEDGDYLEAIHPISIRLKARSRNMGLLKHLTEKSTTSILMVHMWKNRHLMIICSRWMKATANRISAVINAGQ